MVEDEFEIEEVEVEFKIRGGRRFEVILPRKANFRRSGHSERR